MASRFWVGGTGNWDAATTTHWASTTGGAGGASVPTSADDVTFDSNSGAAATVTITAAANANTITVNKSDLTLTHSAGSTVVGAVTLTAGTLNTNGQTCQWASFISSNSNARTVTLGGSQITLTLAGTAWDTSTNTSLVFTTCTATVTINGAAALFKAAGTYTGLSVVISGSGTCNTLFTFSVANFTYTPPGSQTNQLNVGNDFTVTGTFTVTGVSAVFRAFVRSSTIASLRTLTVNTTVTLSHCDLQDMKGAGTASWLLGATDTGDCGGNQTMTLPAGQTNFYKAAANDNFSTAGNWTLATNGAGGAGRIPLPQDTAVFDANSGVHTYTLDMPRFGTLTASAFTGALASSGVSWICYGNLTLGSGMTGWTFSSSGPSFGGRTSQTITSAGKTFATTVTLQPGAVYSQQDDFATDSTHGFNVSGTWSSNGHTCSAQAFTMVSTSTLNMGSDTWKILGSSGTVWTGAGTINGTSATIQIVNASASSRTFAGGGIATYGTLLFTVSSSTGALIITGANTFAGIDVEGSEKTLTLPSATTTTVTGTFKMVGGTLNSSTPGSAHTLSIAA